MRRTVIGERSSGRTGIYVSRDGADALTCSDADLLLDSDTRMFQCIHDATFSWSSVTHYGRYAMRWVAHPDFGFVPLKTISIISGYRTTSVVWTPPIRSTPIEATATGFYVFWNDQAGYAPPYPTMPVSWRLRLWATPDAGPTPVPYNALTYGWEAV